MAKMVGAHVVGTAGTPEKLALAKKAEADEVIDYTKEDFAQKAQGSTSFMTASDAPPS